MRRRRHFGQPAHNTFALSHHRHHITKPSARCAHSASHQWHALHTQSLMPPSFEREYIHLPLLCTACSYLSHKHAVQPVRRCSNQLQRRACVCKCVRVVCVCALQIDCVAQRCTVCSLSKATAQSVRTHSRTCTHAKLRLDYFLLP